MRRKWIWIGLFWVVQAVIPYVLLVPLWAGEWPSASQWARALADDDHLAWTGGAIGLLTLGQALFLIPIRRPQATGRARPVWLSLTVAGLVIAGLCCAAVLALIDVAWMIDEDAADQYLNDRWWVLILFFAAWCIATPLLLAFCGQHNPEALLSQVAARLFLGTLVEALAIIPLNVMMRRRDDCYCAHGTLSALIICAAVGWFALGPALLLPLLARRRKHWTRGHCAACGYDMSGCIDAGRCPECGAGWR